MVNIGSFVGLVAASALFMGCASDPPPPPQTAGAGTASQVAPTVRADQETPTSGSLQVDDRIAKACGLPAPRFPFDSAKIRGEAASRLDDLAKCFTSGALAGKGMKLVGHADARGEVEYNFALGQRRAGSVAEYVTAKGVSASNIATSSRGELDATGTDSDGWAQDRKVDVLLAD